MRLFVLCAFGCLLQAQAMDIDPKQVFVNFTQSTMSLKEFITEIEKQTDYLFMYDEAAVELSVQLTVKKGRQTVSEALESALQKGTLDWRVSDNYILLTAKEERKTAAHQEGNLLKVTGVVYDEQNQPIIGSNIKVKGDNSIGTITDMDGKFDLQVPQGAVLAVSYIGYQTQEIAVKDARPLNIRMKEDRELLDEVVVVGYGVQKKQTMTASASTMKVSELDDIPVSNLSAALGGRVSGVLIQQSGGEAGYDEPTIIIRGSSSPTSSSPLIVVDGVIGRSMSQLDPSEVESLTVLKDASAVAPYGARGANGVILVTTKRGKSGKATVNYNFKVGFGQPTRMPEIASSYDHARLMNEAWRNKEMDMGNDPGLYGVYSEEELVKFRDGTDLYGYPNTNWTKEVLLPRAWQQQHSLTASGGSDKIRYFVGLGYVNQDALYGDTRTNESTSGFKRYNARMNLDAEIIKGCWNSRTASAATCCCGACASTTGSATPRSPAAGWCRARPGTPRPTRSASTCSPRRKCATCWRTAPPSTSWASVPHRPTSPPARTWPPRPRAMSPSPAPSTPCAARKSRWRARTRPWASTSSPPWARSKVTQLAVNNPSEVTFVVPSSLDDGSYTLRIVTQYSAGANLLKEPRVLESTVYIGDAPVQEGGSSSGGGSGEGNEGSFG